MEKKSWTKYLRSNIHAPGTGLALIVLALTQIPIAIKSAAEVACIGEVSHQRWKASNSHKGANVLAVSKCNGGK